MSALDPRALVVAGVPVVATLVGFVALPRPHGVTAAQQAFDRSALGPAVSTTPTTPERPVDVTLGDAIVLRGADLPTAALSRGARLSCKLHFGVVAAVADDWQVFVHIDADDGSFRINADHWPLRGAYRTPLWQTGEFVVDGFDVVVPGAAPPGTYTVRAGLYRGDVRLPVTAGDRARHDGDHRVTLGAVVIE